MRPRTVFLAMVALILATVASLWALESRDALATARVVGGERIVFNWSEQACVREDSPDLPARAIRDHRGYVQLYLSHYVNRRMTGRSVDRLTHPCQVTLASNDDPSPSRFDGREWIAAPYTLNGRRVWVLVHNEFQGHRHSAAMCPSHTYVRCWYNAVTLARSSDGGRTFQHAPPPRHVVVSYPARYAPDIGPVGAFEPSNIVRDPRDGFYYALVRVHHGAPRGGACLMRTRRLSDPRSWRGWDGREFRVRFTNPYAATSIHARRRVCTPVSPGAIGDMTQSLTYNSYFRRWLLVGRAGKYDPVRREVVWGIYFSLSEDLIHWSERRLVKEAELPWTYECGDRDPIAYPSVIDPTSRSRSFETSDRRVHIYFTRFNYKNCRQTPDRDLIRVPVEFSK